MGRDLSVLNSNPHCQNKETTPNTVKQCKREQTYLIPYPPGTPAQQPGSSLGKETDLYPEAPRELGVPRQQLGEVGAGFVCSGALRPGPPGCTEPVPPGSDATLCPGDGKWAAVGQFPWMLGPSSGCVVLPPESDLLFSPCFPRAQHARRAFPAAVKHLHRFRLHQISLASAGLEEVGTLARKPAGKPKQSTFRLPCLPAAPGWRLMKSRD